MSKIWKAISKNYGWIVHFSNHKDLNAFLYANGASHYKVERVEYSKKQDVIKMLNDSAMLAWMNGRNSKSKIKNAEGKNTSIELLSEA